ncbi:alpha/beta hydrolase family protein [Xanthobacter agilis]|uniref:Pimeloyl-ACP methyl ester carboxylesterase n=1 Tax=Xanthobacter agilis TaxID=47492 RepID=A0ABU0L808_XANAG|nr:alpha/beta fold hydrolase [Xanthobacter agilis]MDQ0503238.1 pimeloyl-ACP methyl ester carboxylesterase [Xanthobacter agilis]
MSRLTRVFGMLALACGVTAAVLAPPFSPALHAQTAQDTPAQDTPAHGTPAHGAPTEGAPIEVASGVSYQFIGRWDADRLNEILTQDAPQFFGITVAYTPARNAVRLYRITYGSVIPERGNRPIVATGLLAIPEVSATALPLLSYQHGTVYGKQEVPSFPEQSGETRLALAQFAGQGYVVIGADYFGMGASREPEGYLVKASHQQATYDMLRASRAVLAHMKLSTSKLVLGGWSQGGFVTMALLERLESIGERVAGAATASAPPDGFLALNGFLYFPRKNDASWISTLFILSAFSYETYYGIPGLARALFTDDAYDIARKVYERQPYDPAQIPTDLHTLIRPDYFDPQVFATSAYGRLLKEKANAYRWVIQSPVHNYFGTDDEVISTGVGQLVMTYQHAMGAGNTKVEAISTGATSHRGTYATAVPLWKSWFDGL